MSIRHVRSWAGRGRPSLSPARAGAVQGHGSSAEGLHAFTLAEVMVSLLLIGISLGGILNVYIQSAARSDLSAHSVSAQMSALSGLEQARAAKFDPRGSPPVDQLVSSNFPQRVYVLDVGTSVGPVTYATNITTITTITTNPPLKMIQVDCTWFYPRRGLFTNSVCTYRAANQ